MRRNNKYLEGIEVLPLENSTDIAEKTIRKLQYEEMLRDIEPLPGGRGLLSDSNMLINPSKVRERLRYLFQNALFHFIINTKAPQKTTINMNRTKGLTPQIRLVDEV